ncbi:hypothetical protein [Roseomonas sp. BN140053]|uniref:hypothetical protein n=1 Tax=Roseomonas sp. BN140053 TaxID=3391898 RepID=UPI0039E7351A
MKRNPADLGQWGFFAWQTGWVFALRSAELWATPATAGTTLAEMAMEKQRAFADGWAAASQVALRGGDAQAVAEAAMRPSRRRVAANARALRRKHGG